MGRFHFWGMKKGRWPGEYFYGDFYGGPRLAWAQKKLKTSLVVVTSNEADSASEDTFEVLFFNLKYHPRFFKKDGQQKGQKGQKGCSMGMSG